MSLKKIINFISKNKKNIFKIYPDSYGIKFYIPTNEFKKLQKSIEDDFLQYQYIFLQMLVEQGEASLIANGFSVPTEHAIRFGREYRELFGLDKSFQGVFRARITGETFKNSFSIQMIPTRQNGKEIPNYELKGGMLKITEEEMYLLDEPTWAAFMAVHEHTNLPPDQRTEHVNLATVQILQQAKHNHAPLDLGHFENLPIKKAGAVRLAAEIRQDGALVLSPVFDTGHEGDEIATRLGQLKESSEVGALRIHKEIVILDKKRLDGIREIIENRVIPPESVQEFLKTPQAFLNASLVDLETGFALRVQGAEKFVHIPLGETDKTKIDWFNIDNLISSPEILKDIIQSEEDYRQFEEELNAALGQGAKTMRYNDNIIDISDPEKISNILREIEETGYSSAGDEENIQKNDGQPKGETATLKVEKVEAEPTDILDSAKNSFYSGDLDLSTALRKPFSYQEEGIRWAYGLVLASQRGGGQEERIQGALLADDMGLGKTFMSLMTIAMFMNWQKESGKTVKPTLVVAPLTLIETWQAEVEKSFVVSPFKDQVVLLGLKDLPKFKIEGAKKETIQNFDHDEILTEASIRFALKTGAECGNERLDMPGRLVLCTYQTLRDYQFSLARIDWGMVVFDEAQNIKNPNTLQTRAAKALKAEFKLLATGTPVENSLADFWCLMDTAQPGLLNDWPAFRNEYVKPIKQAGNSDADAIRLDVGRKLREYVGPFMLRRLKAEELDGLPSKKIFIGVQSEGRDEWIFDPLLSSTMKGRQLDAYNQILQGFHQSKGTGNASISALEALFKLRAISLHPAIACDDSSGNPASDDSQKIVCLLDVLDSIKKRNEKAIVFALTKKIQSLLKIWFQKKFGLDVGIINGDTKAVSTLRGVETRNGLIKKFEAKEGFNILIMSPIAAGVGLTIVEANNVIHLERHWNPAKEAQATDRVYRIGQKRDVNIYVPALHHPEHTSFDVLLNKLLMSKIAVSDAVVTPQQVSEKDLINLL
ncbi:MAG: DEAD/DEAH box helicase [Verrucomicrobiae bacterium]|nr:DEAD/DEAH box helicase [Verrucomicrobiae bacterium]